MALILQLLSAPNHQIKIKGYSRKKIYLEQLEELGILEEGEGVVTLNIEQLKKHSVIVPDSLYENFLDINWLREQRKKLNLIQQEVKGEEFRKRQNRRRKKRRDFAKEQKKKRESQPEEELPASQIIFPEEEASE